MRRNRIPGIASRDSAAKPTCLQCGHSDHVVRHAKGMWVCAVHINVQQPAKVERNVVLPAGVRDPDERPHVSYRDIFPNRAARRAGGM